MASHCYCTVNCDKTVFMKQDGGDWIMHVFFVDGMVHASTNQLLKKEFLDLLSQDFETTWNDMMPSFLEMEVEQQEGSTQTHRHTNILWQEATEEYKSSIKKSLKPKKVPMQPDVVLEALLTVPTSRDARTTGAENLLFFSIQVAACSFLDSISRILHGSWRSFCASAGLTH